MNRKTINRRIEIAEKIGHPFWVPLNKERREMLESGTYTGPPAEENEFYNDIERRLFLRSDHKMVLWIGFLCRIGIIDQAPDASTAVPEGDRFRAVNEWMDSPESQALPVNQSLGMNQ